MLDHLSKTNCIFHSICHTLNDYGVKIALNLLSKDVICTLEVLSDRVSSANTNLVVGELFELSRYSLIFISHSSISVLDIS
jgi:hypothetical protein